VAVLACALGDDGDMPCRRRPVQSRVGLQARTGPVAVGHTSPSTVTTAAPG